MEKKVYQLGEITEDLEHELIQIIQEGEEVDDDGFGYFEKLILVDHIIYCMMQKNYAALLTELDEIPNLTFGDLMDWTTFLKRGEKAQNINVLTGNIMKVIPTYVKKGKAEISKATSKQKIREYANQELLKDESESITDTFHSNNEIPIIDKTAKGKKWEFADLHLFCNRKEPLSEAQLHLLYKCYGECLASIIDNGEPKYIARGYETRPIINNKGVDFNLVLKLTELSPHKINENFIEKFVKFSDTELPMTKWIHSQSHKIQYHEKMFIPLRNPDFDIDRKIYNLFTGFPNKHVDGQEVKAEFDQIYQIFEDLVQEIKDSKEYTKKEKQRLLIDLELERENIPKWVNVDLDDQGFPTGNSRYIFQHIFKVWCNEDMNIYNHVIRWFAHIVQFPERKMPVMLMVLGPQGAGKSIIIHNFIKYIIGKEYGLFINDTKDIMGNFNSLLSCKILVCFDDLKKFSDEAKKQVRTLISSEEQIIKIKYKNAAQEYNYATYCQLADNKEELGELPQDNRRFFVVKCDDKYGVRNPIGKKHINEYAPYLTNEEAWIEASHYLAQIDLSDWIAEDFPVTEIMRDLMGNSIHPVVKFCLDLIDGLPIDYVRTDDKFDYRDITLPSTFNMPQEDYVQYGLDKQLKIRFYGNTELRTKYNEWTRRNRLNYAICSTNAQMLSILRKYNLIIENIRFTVKDIRHRGVYILHNNVLALQEELETNSKVSTPFSQTVDNSEDESNNIGKISTDSESSFDESYRKNEAIMKSVFSGERQVKQILGGEFDDDSDT